MKSNMGTVGNGMSRRPKTKRKRKAKPKAKPKPKPPPEPERFEVVVKLVSETGAPVREEESPGTPLPPPASTEPRVIEPPPSPVPPIRRKERNTRSNTNLDDSGFRTDKTLPRQLPRTRRTSKTEKNEGRH